MSAVIDIILVAIIALTLYFCVTKGFVKSLVSTLCFIVALAAALIFCAALGEAFKNNPIGGYIENALADAAETLTVGEVAEENRFESLADMAGAGDVYDDFRRQCATFNGAKDTAVAEGFGKTVAPYITVYLCECAAFLLIFVVVRLLTRTAEYILERAVALPELKQGNRSLGAVVGVLLSLLRINAFCVAFKIIMPLIGGFSEQFVPSSALFKFFSGLSIGL